MSFLPYVASCKICIISVLYRTFTFFSILWLLIESLCVLKHETEGFKCVILCPAFVKNDEEEEDDDDEGKKEQKKLRGKKEVKEIYRRIMM